MSYRDLVEDILQKAGVRQLKPTHEGFTCACPFHNDSSASFAIRDDGLYICYTAACGETGNLYSLLTKVGGYTREQAEKIAEFTPVKGDLARVKTVPKWKDRFKKEEVELLRESALVVYTAFCPKYMLRRGFTKETLKHFQVGYDRETAQVVIPIRNRQGLLAGFLRRNTNKEAKLRYIVDVPKGERSGVLFNFHQVKPGQGLIIVESVMDVMWLWQHGWENAVALLGTTLTKKHERMLSRGFDHFVCMLNSDESGRAATVKFGKRMRKYGLVDVAAPFPSGAKDCQETDVHGLEEAILGLISFEQWMIKEGYQWAKEDHKEGRA